MQELFIFLDDSGVLHKNAREQYFVYAGYVFLSKKQKDYALAKYRAANWKVHKGKNELKACRAKGKTKRFLLSNMKDFESFGCVVDKTRVYSRIMDRKKSIHRYKDYCIKRAIKVKLQDLIARGVINADVSTNLHFYIDNQPTSTDGVYNLRESIREELSSGIANFDYGTFYRPLFNDSVVVSTDFCDSRYNYLIQASDMLANCIFSKYNYKPDLNHGHLHHSEILLP